MARQRRPADARARLHAARRAGRAGPRRLRGRAGAWAPRARGRATPSGRRRSSARCSGSGEGPRCPSWPTRSRRAREIARVEERRLVALEGRVEADLALGRHGELVGELEAAVARDPLRERLRLQLMLALYRSGRRAEALQAYQDARRALATELGLDPGTALQRLERAILEQDPALEPPRPRTLPATARVARPAIATAGPLTAAALLVLAAAAAAIVESQRGARRRRPARRPARELGRGDRRASGRIVSQTPVGENPGSIAAGAGAVWVLNGDDRTVRASIRRHERRPARSRSAPSRPPWPPASGRVDRRRSTPSDPRIDLGPGNLVGARGGTDRWRLGRDGRAHRATARGTRRPSPRAASASWRSARAPYGRSRLTVRWRGSTRRPTARELPAAASTRARWRSAAAACGRLDRGPTARRRSGRSRRAAATSCARSTCPRTASTRSPSAPAPSGLPIRPPARCGGSTSASPGGGRRCRRWRRRPGSAGSRSSHTAYG